jgi:hypothetical protein
MGEGKPNQKTDLNQMPSDEEMAEFGRSEDERRKRLDASPLHRMAREFTRLAIIWIQANAAFERAQGVVPRDLGECGGERSPPFFC